MISDQSNMGRKQIFDELPLPSKIEDKLLAKFTYKGMFIIVKLLLDIRSNLVKISEGKVIKPRGKRPEKSFKKKPDNPIKGLDKIELKEGSVIKGGVNQVSDTNKPDLTPASQQKTSTKDKEIPSSREKPDQIRLGESEKK